MYDLVIQICFIVAGTVTGCTEGVIQTDNPYLSSQDLSPVYVYDAPQCIDNYYQSYYTPPVKLYTPHRRPARVVHRHHDHKARPKVVVKHRHHHHKARPKVVVKHRRPDTKTHRRRHKKSKVVIPQNVYKRKKSRHKKHKKKHRKH